MLAIALRTLSAFRSSIGIGTLEVPIGVCSIRQFTKGDPKKQGGDVTDAASRKMPAEHIDLFEVKIDRLVRGKGYGDEP